MVYINGVYVSDADLLPRSIPSPGEDDPGLGLTFDMDARNLLGYDIEIIVVNGDETASASTRLEVSQTPLLDEIEFLNSLYQGLFQRNPESYESGYFYFDLRDGIITREDVIQKLLTTEFKKARDMLVAHKTLTGEWKNNRCPSLNDPSFSGEIAGGSTNIANRPDDAEDFQLAPGWMECDYSR